MHATTVLRMVGVTRFVVEDFVFEEEGLVAVVRPRWSVPRCAGCGFKAPGYDRAAALR